MKIGYIRKAPGYPVAKQRAALTAFGCEKIYEESRQETRADALAHGLRHKNDRLVLFSLHLLGRSRADLQFALEEAEKKGVHVTDLSHPKLIATAEQAAWITDALRKITGENRTPTKAQAAEGGRKRKGKLKAREKTRAELHEIWFSKAYLTNEDAAEAAGVPVRALYRLFGGSRRPAGWPGKRVQEIPFSEND